MAAKIVKGTGVVFPEIKAIAKELRDFPRATRRKYMRAAFTAAANVGKSALKKITPRGPTGNLKKSVVAKSSPGYGLAGYRRPPRKSDPDDAGSKGSHQGFLEFGTKPRRTKGRIASSFNTKTKGRQSSGMRIVVASRGKNAGKLRTTNPKYPKSFFKAAPRGQTVDLKRMPVGGRLGKPPIVTAFKQSQSQITTVLREQLATAYTRASKDIADKFPPRAGR